MVKKRVTHNLKYPCKIIFKMEKELGFKLCDLQHDIDFRKFSMLFWIGLLWKYPKLAREKSQEILDRYGFEDVSKMISKGLDRSLGV